ncbi:MAG: alginate lyase family protein [Maribacter sp.]|uniref:alginate lyase family protein n=1 Tax=Maribacter sp. TaxID=1897614 RepID=UPI003299B72E
MNIKTILSKPLPVVWFRLVQLVRLKFYHSTAFWKTIELKVSGKVSSSKSTWKERSLLFCKKFQNYDDAFLKSIQTHIRQNSDRVLQGDISIFDVPYQFDQPFNWHADWRIKHQWKNRYFKEYSFYETEKLLEYDVKFPWEFSRLSFLIPIARRYLLDNETEHLEYVHGVLQDWKQKNPIAHSINWYPMEVSVRSINLIQLRELLLLRSTTEKTLDLLNEILILHGIFLWRNIEYTDVRGNHYAANLTALLLLGTTFKGFYSEAKQWQKYALANIEPEFHLQFIDDGVNFEKSIAYHRLVVEFYFIGFLTMQRLGIEVQPKTKEVFKESCLFIKSVTKPNFLTPIIGDNDSASVFQNDDLPLNDHTNLLQLNSIFLDVPVLNSVSKTFVSALEVFGLEKVRTLKHSLNHKTQLLSYSKGGFVIVKNNSNYFIADIGEVGMKGRGGHGHNDLYSFELMLEGCDFIVDAGCYTYTGDLVLKNQMKSSAYHNILTVDEKEIAPLIGNWGIADIAKPYEVLITEDEESINVSGKHDGYKRLPDTVVHQRTFKLQKQAFELSCFDTVSCSSSHHIQRHLHFSEHVGLALKENVLLASLGADTYTIICDEHSKPRLGTYYLSYNYGHKITSKKVIFESKIEGTSELHFSIIKDTSNEQN